MTEEKPLHVKVAEALGWTRTHYRFSASDPKDHSCGDIMVVDPERLRWKGRSPDEMLIPPHGCQTVPRYDTDWSATGPLIEKYRIHISRWNRFTGSRAWWFASTVGFNPQEEHEETVVESRGCDTPLEAVCHLILALSEAGKLPK